MTHDTPPKNAASDLLAKLTAEREQLRRRIEREGDEYGELAYALREVNRDIRLVRGGDVS